MLESLKSVGYYTAFGAVTGATIGAGVGLANVPLVCGFEAVTGVFFDQFLNGHSPHNLDRGAALFQTCRIKLPIEAGIAFGLAGGALGMIYGISKEVFRHYRVNINIQRVNQ